MLKERILIIKNRKYGLPIISLLATMGILFGIYSYFGIYPMGDKVIPTIDLKSQYMPFLNLFKEKFLSGESVFYSYNGGLGQNYWGHIGYYTASPLNIFLIFFPYAYLNEGIYFLTLLKLGLSAFTMNLLLVRAFGKRTWVSVGFALAYGLSSYALAYSIHLMWLDTLIALPLCILGLIKIIREERLVLYSLSLFYMVWSNFYTGAFACFLLVLIFPFIFFRFAKNQSGKEIFRKFAFFTLGSLLGGLMATILWLPTMRNLEYTMKLASTPPDLTSLQEAWLDLAYRFLPNSKPTIRSGPPNIYMGIFPLLMALSYGKAKNINIKAKFSSIALMAFIFFSLNSDILNYVWHGFSYPHSFDNRFAFTLVFAMVFIGYDSFLHMGDKRLVLALALGIIGLGLVKRPEEVWIGSLVLISVLPLIYFSLISYKVKKFSQILALVMVVEASLGAMVVFSQRNFDLPFGARDEERSEVKESIEDFKLSQAYMHHQGRLALIASYEVNNGARYGYPSMEIFDSTYYEGGTEFFLNMGYLTNLINSITGPGLVYSQPLNDVLGMSYYISADDKFDKGPITDPMSPVYRDLNIEVWENPNALSLGIYTEKYPDLEFNRDLPMENQNKFFAFLGAEEDLYDLVGSYVKEASFEKGLSPGQIQDMNSHIFTIEEAGTYSLSWVGNEKYYNDMYISVKGADYEEMESLYNRGTYHLGRLEAGDELSLVVEENHAKAQISYSLSKLNEPAYEAFIGKLKDRQMVIDSIEGHKFEGHMETAKEGYIFISLPYDEGWTFEVNGQKTRIIDLEGLMAIEVPRGPVEIKANFVPRGLYLGLAISLIASLAMLVLGLKERINKCHKDKTML